MLPEQRLNNNFNSRGLIKLFTIKEGISYKLLSKIIEVGSPHYKWVDNPEGADYLVFPSNYEVGHELSHYYLHYFDGNPYDRDISLKHEEELIKLSKQFNKKIIIIYFSDSAAEINVKNAIIFRTSIEKSKGRKNEISMPVIKNNLALAKNNYSEFIEWEERPAIGFRGIATSLKLKKTRIIRNQINLLANRFQHDDIFNLRKNYGYLERRNALIYLARNKNIAHDFAITKESDANDENSTKLFIDSVFKNPYTLCSAGFGNYSYRFFEVLSAGRIPVFVDTDCKLPFEEFINWRDHVVWVERKDIPRIGKILLDFHQSKKGDDFIRLQRRNRDLWKEYLSPENFFIKIKVYL